MRPLLHVPCSRCGAKLGEPCTVNGTRLVTRSAAPHAARRQAARADARIKLLCTEHGIIARYDDGSRTEFDAAWADFRRHHDDEHADTAWSFDPDYDRR